MLASVQARASPKEAAAFVVAVEGVALTSREPRAMMLHAALSRKYLKGREGKEGKECHHANRKTLAGLSNNK